MSEGYIVGYFGLNVCQIFREFTREAAAHVYGRKKEREQNAEDLRPKITPKGTSVPKCWIKKVAQLFCKKSYLNSIHSSFT